MKDCVLIRACAKEPLNKYLVARSSTVKTRLFRGRGRPRHT